MDTAALDVTTAPFTLPPDAKVVAVSELSPRLQARIGPVQACQAVVTRPGYRVTTRLVPGPFADLLAEFRSPSLMSDAVLRFARAHDQDPLDVMDLAFDGLASLVEARILVPAGSPDLAMPQPSLAAGQACAGFEIEALVRALDDSEVYRARRPDGAAVALKVAGRNRPHVAAVLAHEARVLAQLDGCDAPRLLAAGHDDGRAYVAMEWCDGDPVAVVAQRARASGHRRRVHALVSQVLAAYARLHARGLLHGDVHPGNCLVKADGHVVLIDFGNARSSTATGGLDPTRTGVPQFYDPLLARAVLARRIPPAVDAKAEQFSVAVLAYLLLTGLHPLDAPSEQRELLRRIVDRRMLPFTARGVPAWPEVEAVLRRALSADPAERFPDLTLCADTFARATVTASTRRRGASRDAAVKSAVAALRIDTATSPAWELGWVALRAALLLDDAELLARADVLSSDASAGWPGHAVAVQVARARSDVRLERQWTAAFLAAAQSAAARERPGALLAASRLLDGGHAFGEAESVAQWVRAEVTQRLARSPRPGGPGRSDALTTYVALLLTKAGVAPLQRAARARLERMATAAASGHAAESTPAGLEWLWALAHEVFADSRFLRLTLATTLPAAPLPRVLALVRRYQLTGNTRWVECARRVAATRAGLMSPVTAALIAVELGAPERMCPAPHMNPFVPEIGAVATARRSETDV